MKINKRIIISILLFLVIFTILGFYKFRPWEYDDFHSIYNSWCKILFYFFNNGDSNQSVETINYIRPTF